MTLPFTVEEFLGVFAAYNLAIWPVQIVASLAGLVALAAIATGRWPAGRLVPAILAVLWAINGIGYHLVFFARINPLAWGFAALFVLQAGLLLAAALATRPLTFDVKASVRTVAGAAIIFYAALIYPVLGILAGHGLLAGPMFGVAPCPTTLFTIGILLLARGPWVVRLSIIPILWSLIGIAAALQLGIYEDLGLSVAGAALVAALGSRALADRRLGDRQQDEGAPRHG